MSKPLPPYADSLKSAAAMLGCSIADLKRAKASGCDGFKGGRVYFDKVEPWLKSNLPPEPDDDLEEKEILERRKLREQVLTVRRNREILEGKYTANDTIRAECVKAVAVIRGELARLKVDAPAWEGMPAPEIESRIGALIDSICANLRETFGNMSKAI
jgi:hypothetical protein